MRGILCLIQPMDPVLGVRVDVRVGGGLNSRMLNLNGQKWATALARLPRLAMELMDDEITGSLKVARGDLTLHGSRLGVANVPKLIWDGAPITIWSGSGPQWADMTLEFFGTCISGVQNKDNLQIPVAFEIDQGLLDVPLLQEEYGGGGGADGEPDVRGQLKPLAFGNPINVPVFFFDQTLWIGQVDSGGRTNVLDLLYEDGALFEPKFADYPNYAALYAAANGGLIPEGLWATCVAEGMVALGAPPQGVITADPACDGATPGTLALAFLEAAGVTAGRIDEASFANWDDELEAVRGHIPPVSYWTQGQVSTLDRVQVLCASFNSMPLLRLDGQIAVTRCFGGDVELTLTRHGGQPKVTSWRSFDPAIPWWRLKMSAERTWRVHSEAEIDYENDIVDMGDYNALEEYRQGQVVRFTDGYRYLYINVAPSTGNDPPDPVYWDVYEDPIDASTVRYLDGTPVEDLQPGQAGADVTGSNTAAAIVSQGALATLNKVRTGTGGEFVGDNGITVLSQAQIETSVGTAAAIVSQGSFATLSSINSTLADTNNLLRRTAGGLFSGELAADVTLTHTASAITGQGSFATLSAINSTLANANNLLRYTSGGLFSGELTADVTLTHTASAITGQGSFATLSAISAALANTNNLLRYTSGGLFSGELAADVTSTHTASAITGQGTFATLSAINSTLANANNLLRYTSGGLFSGELAADVTSTHTASAIASQGALATLSQVSLGASGRVYRDDGTTRLTDLLAVTSLGTAAAITNQGSFATLSAINSTLADSNNLLRRTAGGLFSGELAADVTLTHTASAITGQGSFATLSSISSGLADTNNLLRRTAGGLFSGELAADVTLTHTAAAFTGQAAIATDTDAVGRILAMRGDNLFRTDLFNAGSFSGMAPGDVTVVPYPLGIADPAPYGAVFPAGLGSSAYIYLADTIPAVANGRVVFGSCDYYTNGVGASLRFGALCFDRNGGNLGPNFVDVAVSHVGGWQRVSFPPFALLTGTATFKPYIQRTVSAAALQIFTNPRAAFTQYAATLGATASTNLFRSDGVTVLSQAEVRTLEGTAAAFTGQAAIATDSDAAARILSMRSENLVRNGNFIEGGSFVTGAYANMVGGDATVVPIALANTDPAPYAVIFPNGLATGLSYLYVIYFYAAPALSRNVYGSVDFYANGVATTFQMVAVCFNRDGADIGTYPVSVKSIPATAGWQTVDFGPIVLPSNTASFRIYFQRTGANGANHYVTKFRVGFTQRAADVTTDQPVVSRLNTTTGRATDQRIFAPIAGLNLGFRYTGAVTYTAAAGTPATATISIAAGNMLFGTTPIAYNALSVGVTGTGGTTVTHYLYVNESADPASWGGTKTLVATTNRDTVYGADDRAYFGFCDVTFPAAGTGGGSGSGGGGVCVWVNAWLEVCGKGFVQAGDVAAGDYIRVLTDDRLGTTWAQVTDNETGREAGWRIVSKSGIACSLSESTPITLRDGSLIRVAEIAGHELPIHARDAFFWEPCFAEPIGEIEVARIRVNQKTYFAGDIAGMAIGTHNPKP